MYESMNVAFTLRVRVAGESSLIVIKAFDDCGWDDAGRVKLEVEVRHAGRVIFPRGQLYCALHGTSDGVAARALVLSLVGMNLGDTDRSYFDSYSEEQLRFATSYGDALTMEREARFGESV